MGPLLTLRVALLALARNKLRTALTMLGIIIGVATVVTLLSLGTGAKTAMEQMFTEHGRFTVDIMSANARMQNQDRFNPLGEEELDALSGFEGVKDSYPRTRRSFPVSYRNRVKKTSVVGTANSYFGIHRWEFASGREFTEIELRSGALVTVLGHQVAFELFGDSDPMGKSVKVDGLPLKVIGVLKERGADYLIVRDDIVVVPYRTMSQRLLGRVRFEAIVIEGHDQEGAASLGEEAVKFLNRRQNINNPDRGYFYFRRPEGLEMGVESVETLTKVLAAIAAIALVVGGIGIMNIMLVAVTERIKEIGIRMSVGARTTDILAQFLVESVLICCIGGTIGIALGAGAAYKLSEMSRWPFVFTPIMAVIGFAGSVLVGLFFGVYPAYRASQLDPIDALAG